MEIQIRRSNLHISENTIGFIERRLDFALRRFQEAIEGVTVRLSDLNGPRGGIDKSCQIRVFLPGSKMLVVEERDADLFAAIASAVERMGRVLAKASERRKSTYKG